MVSKLIEDCQLNVVHTIDGKEYVTRQHLITEIKNEARANKGMILICLPYGSSFIQGVSYVCSLYILNLPTP